MIVAPYTVEPCEAPTPTPADLGEGEVLLRVRAVGICGSDLPVYRGQITLTRPSSEKSGARLPGYPSHEVAGTVVASRHPDLEVGTEVAGWATRHDALAEYTITRGDSVAPYDPALPPEHAVALQSLACVLPLVDRLPPLAGRHVAVIGQGPLGLLFSHVAKSAGARLVTGVDRVDRTDLAKSFQVDNPVQAASDRWARTLADDERPDVVIEAVGHQTSTLTHAIEAVAPDGHVLYFGVPDDEYYPIPMNTVLRKNLTLHSGFTRDRRKALRDAGEYVRRHPNLLPDYVTHVLSADEAQRGYEIANTPSVGRVKVVLTVQSPHTT